MLRLVVVGCGGLGKFLLERLPGVMASLSLAEGNYIQDHDEDNLDVNTRQYQGEEKPKPLFSSLTLIDADTFSPTNAIRQGAITGSKLAHCIAKLKRDPSMALYLSDLELIGYNRYANINNIAEMIPPPIPVEPRNRADVQETREEPNKRIQNISKYVVFFLCVDNLQTRYEMSRYAETLDNVIVFNGGNSLTSGHVTIFERENGVDLDPKLSDLYPEVKDGANDRPDQRHCDEVSVSFQQLSITNSMVVDCMLARFIRWVSSGLTEVKTRAGKQTEQRTNEVLVNINGPSILPLQHKRS